MQRVVSWTPEEYAYLLELMERNPDHTYRQYAEALARRFGREFTAEAVRSKLKRAGSQKARIHFLDRKNADVHDPEKLLRRGNLPGFSFSRT